MNRLIALIALAVTILLGGSLLWLAEARMMPPVQKLQLSIPDDRIPR